MNTRFLFVVGWIFVGMTMTTTITTTTDAAAVVPSRHRRASSAPPPPPPNSWFREKYLVGTYDIYHDYTLHRYELGDNDIDKCPDIYNGASLYAITGRHINQIKRTCHVLPTFAATAPPTMKYETPDIRIGRVKLVDILQFLFQITCYTFEIGMIVISIILAACSTLFMFILLFCQY